MSPNYTVQALTAVVLAMTSGTALAYADTTVEAPSDIIGEAEWFLTSVDLGSPTISTAPGLTYDTSNDAPALFRVGSTVVTWLVQDSAGGRAMDTQTVTIRDTTLPECPEDPTFFGPFDSRSGKKIQVAFDLLAITDKADLSVDVAASHESGSKFPVGNTTVTFTGIDDYGNTVDCPVIVRIVIPVIENLRLVQTHDTIAATWDEFEGHTTYQILLADAGGETLQKSKIRGNSHTFPDLESDTEYSVKVSVHDYKKIGAEAGTTTLPPPLVITDDFSGVNGWTYVPTVYTSGFNNYAFSIDATDGNPAPSAKISGDGELANSRIEKWFDLDRGGGPLFFGIDYKSASDAPLYGQIVVETAGSQAKYVKSIWIPAQASGWNEHLADISGGLGDGDRTRVQLYLYDLGGADDGYTIHYDNLYLSTVRPDPVFQGGSGHGLTAEQEEFDRILSQILGGEIDPYGYMSGAETLGQYDELLRRVLESLGIVRP